jgi:hypothetical protein
MHENFINNHIKHMFRRYIVNMLERLFVVEKEMGSEETGIDK